MKSAKNALADWIEFYRDIGIDAVDVYPGKIDTRSKREMLDECAKEVSECAKCRLSEEGRTQTVFGVGNPDAIIMFVGEGPGEEEDRRGVPFVGRAGQLLTRIIEDGMKMKRDDVYIANIVKCRPPANRTPRPDEVAMCLPYLLKQIKIIKPKIIVSLGSPATQALLGENFPISRIRGRFRDFFGVQLMPTYHPAYILRDPSKKKDLWEDIKKVIQKINILKNPDA